MATISLTTYVNILPGETRITEIPSVAIPGGKKPPKGKILAVYGTKDALTVLKEARSQSRVAGLDTYRVDIGVPVGELPVGKTALEDLVQSAFLNIKRIKVDTAEALLDIVYSPKHLTLNDFKALNLNESRSGAADIVKIIAYKPSLLDVIWDDPRFAHLNVIVWPAPIPGKRLLGGEEDTLQIAAIRPESVSETTIRNFTGDASGLRFQTF